MGRNAGRGDHKEFRCLVVEKWKNNLRQTKEGDHDI